MTIQEAKDSISLQAEHSTNDLKFINATIDKIDYLKELKSQLNGIASNWNGDESGIAEERAIASSEGIELIEKLESILEELNIK